MNAKQRRVARRAEERRMRWPVIRVTCTGADEVVACFKRIADAFRVPAELMAATARTFTEAAGAMQNFSRAWIAEDPRHILWRDWLAQRPALPPDTVATLLDLARAGNESDFRWLAASAGVRAEELGGLWTGTVARTR